MNKVIIFSAPSGSGKTTLVKYALENFQFLKFSVSCTTRKPRGEEKDGLDYHFISVDEFRTKINHSEFVEFEEVYPDKFYGTLLSEVEKIWKDGKMVIFDVDVKGGMSLKKFFGENALSIFIMPPSVEELEQRLLQRATDDLETINIRTAKASEEMKFQYKFDKIVVNSDLQAAKEEVSKLISEFASN